MTITQKFDTNIKPRYPFGSKRYIYLAFLGLLILGITEIWVNNAIVNFGAKYEVIINLQQSLAMENQVLENQLATQLSLSNIATKSAELGFLKSKDIINLR